VCLVILALGQHPQYPLILAANRDEFHARPSAALHAWPDRPGILGGRDLEKGGSWLAAAQRGALAVVTNVRDPARRVTGGPSRGDLVSDFLGDDTALAAGYVADRCAPGLGYDGFNLIAVDRSGAWYGSNRGAVHRLGAGVHGLSNHLLDTDWPKVRRLRAAMQRVLEAGEPSPADALMVALSDRVDVPDEALPATGVPLEWERRLAPPFIVSPDYGTRCSSVALIDRDGVLTLTEHSFDPEGNLTDVRRMSVQLERPPGPWTPAA
jgi:uncharacterized protein with NRDE domain